MDGNLPPRRIRYDDGMELSVKHRILRSIGHLHWLRGRDRILRAFSHPDRQKSFPFETDFFGQTYAGDLTNFIDWTVFYYGAFVVHELHLLADITRALRALGKPVKFFDVGANIGHHTVFMSGQADHVFSFEPFVTVRKEMERKLARANVHNVTIFPVALGDRNTNGAFTPPTGANQGTGTLGDILPDNASAEQISVQVVRADDFFAANQLPPVSLLKMDVEGYEVKALEGLRETLRRDRPPILMEIQHAAHGVSESSKSASARDLLYPDHLLFNIGDHRGRYVLRPFTPGGSEEALVLPAELAGIVPGTSRP
jgi:FkbM family methyltransferase